MTKVEDILLAKARAGKLAHFYIVETASLEDSASQLMEFVHGFIRNYYQKVEDQKLELKNLMDHPDVLVLGQRDEDKKEAAFYSVTEAEELAKFFNYRPLQGKRKFVVIPDAHRINVTVANKWLKLLEEPPQEVTIFLLNPRKMKLLDTIHSRALHLRLPSPIRTEVDPQWNEFLNKVKGLSLASFLEEYSRGEVPLSVWVSELLQWESQRDDAANSKLALERWLKLYEEMEVFHQPTATKWTLFYSHLKDHVLPRL